MKREDTIDIVCASHGIGDSPGKSAEVTDLPQAFYRWESSLKEFQRGRPDELDDDVKANAMRHMMPKEVLDAVDLQTQDLTFSENSGLHDPNPSFAITRITKQGIEEFGATVGCPGCYAIKDNKRAQAHSHQSAS